MNKLKYIALLLCAVMGASAMTACGKEKSSSVEAPKEWELITPDEGDEEYSLGSYRIDPETGIKLYYDEEEFPRELAIALEKHFLAFQNRDFDSFREQNFPLYNEEMEEFLQSGYQYGIEESFGKQVDSINENCGGSFEITRVKIEPSEQFETQEEGIEDFLVFMGEIFESDDFGDKVREETDELLYFSFFVMAKNADGEEIGIVSEHQNNTVFALKDGKYYSFG